MSVTHAKFLRLFVLLLAALSFTVGRRSAASPAAPRHLRYEITYSAHAGTPCLDVTLTLVGGTDGISLLALPPSLTPGGAYPNVSGVRVTSPRATIADADKPQVKRLTYPPGQSVTLDYRVTVTDTGQQMEQGYSPQVAGDHLSILGHQLFALPALSANTPLTVAVDWSLPAGWALADSYGVQQLRQTFTATPETLQGSVWAAGDYRVPHTLIRGKPVYLAVRGKWPIPDEQMLATFSRIIGREREFWHDDTAPYYLVVLNSSDSDIVGMSFVNSFYEAAPPAEGLSPVTEHVFAHEAFHAWLPHRITLAGPPHTYDWFYEGFTDYYARLFLLRGGLLSPQQYTDDCNAKIRDYVSSPFRNISGPQFRRELGHRGSDYRVLRIAYLRGDLLAQHWNALIRLSSHGRYSLDDVMLDLLRLARTGHRPLEVSDLVKTIRHYARRDVSSDIPHYGGQGATINPDPAALGPCARLLPTRTTLFDMGYDLSGSSHRGKIVGVKVGSNAYRAGLRDGQTYLDVDFKNGDPAKEARITVKDQAAQRIVTYYPAGETVSIPQYKLRPGVLDAACLSWFGLIPHQERRERNQVQ